MANEYSINAKITADSTGFEKGIKSAQNLLKGFSSSISSAMKLAGGLFAVGSIAQLGKALSDMSQSYAKATQNIVRGTGAVGDQLKTLQKSVNASLINGVGRDASELGEMVADLNTRLGVTGDTLTELVSQFNDFSDVTGTDTKTAINSVSDVLAKWNIEASQTVPLLDQLTAASQASGASVTELTNGLKSGQAVFSQFGMSATESIAFLGTLKKNGIDTSSAIMGMKTALANFAKSGLDAKTAFAEISESIKNAGTQTEALSIATQTFGQRNGAEFVRILSGGTEGVDAFTEALENAGGTLARTNEASRTSADALEDLKATIAGVFATSGTDNGLRDLIDDVAKAIRSFDFSSIEETFSNIGLFIQGVWEQFKALFNNLSGAVDIADGNFKIFADIIYDNLNSAYQTIQDLVGMVSAVLDGDWSVAWEYAKLIVLRTVKQMEESVNNAIKLMPNLFNSVVEGYNWVLEQQDKLFLEVFHLPEKYFKSAKLPKFEGKDLIDTTSIEEAIEEVRKTIESKTGKIADRTLADLKKQKKAVHATTQSVTADIGDLGTAVEDTTETTGTKVSDFFAEWTKQYEDLAGNWEKTFSDMANIGAQAMGDMFQQLGQDLVDGGIGFENYSAVAVEAISQVLVALSAQITALGVTHALSLDFAGAALAAAGAAAALVAAGALKSVANNMKKTSEATKEASMSLKEFKERLENIWSGKSTSISVVASMRETDVIIKNSTNALKTAQAEYEKTVKQNNEKIKELEKSINDRTKAQVAAAVLVPIFGAVGAAQVSKSIEKDRKKINKLVDEIVNANQKVMEAETKLRMANAQYLQGIRDTNESLEAQIAENRSVVSDYKTLYSSLNGYNKEMSRSKEIVTELAKVVKNELLVNTTSLLNEVYSSFGGLGKDIGETLMNSITDGASKSDFMDNMKKMIKQKILQLTIYTESFTKQIAQVGEKLVKSLMNDNKGLESVTKELSTLYDETAKKADKVNDLLNKAFNGYIDETADEVADKVDEFAEKLENLRSVVGNLKESLKTLRSQATSSFQNLVSNYKSVSEELESLISAQQAVVDSLNKQKADKIASHKRANGVVYMTTEEYSEYKSLLTQITAAEKELADLKKDSRLLKVRVLNETRENLKKENSVLSEQISLYKSLYTLINVPDLSYKEIFTQTQINAIRSQLLNVQSELMNTATQIGSNIASSIAKGATKADFMSSIKDYMKNQIISLVVYSSEFESTLTELGRKMTKAISSGSTNFTDLEKELSSLYDTVEKKVKTAYASLDRVFPDVNKNLKETSGSAKTATVSLSKLGEKIKSLKETLSDLGGDLADKLANGLKSGLSKNDMLATMKDYIKDMIIQTVVYTDSMKSQIESVGKKIAQAINSGNYSDVLGAKEKIGSLYDTLTTKSKTALKWVEQLFPEMSKTVEKETVNVEKSLTKLESAVQSFKETIADLGGDIADNLVDGLTNGLSQSDFLTNMKNWIKKMLVQSVVYTEQMKSQIEAIGKTISNAISGGFTETSMHEIRRDLSYIFEQATSKMSGIDKILGGVFDGYATGTTSALSGLHIVGERGPELVRFRGGEQVFNNRDTMSMLSGGNKTNNFNVTFNNLQDTSAYAMMSQLKRYNREMAINGVI